MKLVSMNHTIADADDYCQWSVAFQDELTLARTKKSTLVSRVLLAG
jgi:hypothetical protein